MANPLRWFRRHAKILMVVLGSAAMAIFGLGPVFDTLASRSAGGAAAANELIATWNGGDITRADLDTMKYSHYQAIRFLAEVRKQAVKKKGDEYGSLAMPIRAIQGDQREMVDEALITRYLLAERAKEEGIIVSEGMVKDYIVLHSGDADGRQGDGHKHVFAYHLAGGAAPGHIHGNPLTQSDFRKIRDVFAKGLFRPAA